LYDSIIHDNIVFVNEWLRAADNPSTTYGGPPSFAQGRADYNNKCNTKKIDFTETMV